jgi:pyruvate dehydrogenase E1 component beta subunit
MPEGPIIAERVITAADAIREALDQALAADPAVYLMGEGVADPKGIFGTTTGLAQKYGPDRVIEMPVAENGLTGVAIGSALMGQRPVLIHQRVEFCLLAMEQLVNNAAKLHYVSGGRHAVPMVIRLVVGRGWGQGPQHSQSLEALFAHVPGLKLVMPATAADAKGLLLGAIADDNPVVFLEHRWVHYVSGQVPELAMPLALDGPRRLRIGEDVTVVATSYMVLEALQALDSLAGAGVSADLFDLRVLRPLEVAPIVESVRRTGRLVCVDTGYTTYGIGAEVAQRVTEACFGALRAPPRRLGLPDHPTPSSRTLAEAYYPRSSHIAAAIGEVASLNPAAVTAAQELLAARREDLPLDIPHPSFRGPF